MSQQLEQIKQTFVGNMIGEGCYRKVHECRLDPSLVIKLEKTYDTFSNIMEWKVWQEVEYSPFKKWFAPCVFMSDNGDVLIQKKVDPISKRDKLPDSIPAFLSDIKPENFGFFEGRLVCSDYGSLPITAQWSEKKMKKANWKDLLT